MITAIIILSVALAISLFVNINQLRKQEDQSDYIEDLEKSNLNYYNFFDQKLFSKILCYSGVLLSISMFFMFGVEEVAYPVGAIIFHQDGIAKTLGVLLVALLPVLLMSEEVEVIEQEDEGFESDTHTVFGQEDDSNWEVATDEEIDSGKFETV